MHEADSVGCARLLPVCEAKRWQSPDSQFLLLLEFLFPGILLFVVYVAVSACHLVVLARRFKQLCINNCQGTLHMLALTL